MTKFEKVIDGIEFAYNRKDFLDSFYNRDYGVAETVQKFIKLNSYELQAHFNLKAKEGKAVKDYFNK